MQAVDVPQWAEALEIGNERRLAQARLKRDLRALDFDSARELVAGLIEEAPPEVGAMRVGALILCVRKIGEKKVGRYLVTAGCSRTRRIRDLTERQRLAIATSLRA